MILVFGSINIDLVARVTSIPRPGETVLSPRYDTLFGGKGANQAVAAARVSKPGRVAMAARIGDDSFGHMARRNLEDQGVDVALVGVGPEPTGCAFITVQRNGENAITAASGANGALTEATIPGHAIDRSTVLVLQMEVPFVEALKLARRTKAVGGRVLWNFAPAPTDFTANNLSELLAATDFFVVNEHEALAALTILGCNQPGMEEAGAALAAKGGCICIMTAGERGALAFLPDGRRETAAATPIKPVDTTGAGDTFLGILANSVDEDADLAIALHRSCFGASQACLFEGAQAGMPTRQQLDAWQRGAEVRETTGE